MVLILPLIELLETIFDKTVVYFKTFYLYDKKIFLWLLKLNKLTFLISMGLTLKTISKTSRNPPYHKVRAKDSSFVELKHCKFKLQ